MLFSILFITESDAPTLPGDATASEKEACQLAACTFRIELLIRQVKPLASLIPGFPGNHLQSVTEL